MHPKNKGNNPITDNGCQYISETKWPSLEVLLLGSKILILGNCEVGEKGCLYISALNASELQALYLGMYISKEIAIRWEVRVVNSWLGEIGPNWKNYPYVTMR